MRALQRVAALQPDCRRALGAALIFLSLAAPIRGLAAGTDVPDLLAARRCGACHALTEQLIGPPYQAIAVRHSARAAVMVEALAQKIILGGGGNWGVVPMVPNEHVTLEEARSMAQWILKLDGAGR